MLDTNSVVRHTKQEQTTETRAFIPAMGRQWLLPIYDLVTKLLGVDRSRRVLVDRAALRPGERVLDVGCGTGTLAILLKREHPDVTVVALDPDPKALAKARRKARRAGVSLQLNHGFADALPYPDGTFAHVFSTFMLHHLERDAKEGMLREIRRVLEPGGRLHLLDFTRAESRAGEAATAHGHAHGRLEDNMESRVIACLIDAGLVNPRSVDAGPLLRGHLPITYFEAAAATE